VGDAAGLQLFPLMHEVADLPHQGLMAVDERLRGGPIVVEAGRCHCCFDLPDRLLAFGNARFEVVDARAAGVDGARVLAGFGVGALFFLMVAAGITTFLTLAWGPTPTR